MESARPSPVSFSIFVPVASLFHLWEGRELIISVGIWTHSMPTARGVRSSSRQGESRRNESSKHISFELRFWAFLVFYSLGDDIFKSNLHFIIDPFTEIPPYLEYTYFLIIFDKYLELFAISPALLVNFNIFIFCPSSRMISLLSVMPFSRISFPAIPHLSPVHFLYFPLLPSDILSFIWLPFLVRTNSDILERCNFALIRLHFAMMFLELKILLNFAIKATLCYRNILSNLIFSPKYINLNSKTFWLSLVCRLDFHKLWS